MSLKLVFLIILTFLISISNAQEIYLENYNGNMNLREVKTKLYRDGFKKIEVKKDYIIANKQNIYGNLLFYEFHFCKNKLVSFRKDYEPSMKNFIQIFNLLSKRYGKILHGYSSIDLLSAAGESRTLTLTWFFKDLEIELTYDIFETNDVLTVRFYKKNNCD